MFATFLPVEIQNMIELDGANTACVSAQAVLYEIVNWFSIFRLKYFIAWHILL
jgi:hypothetical protein